MLSVVFFVYTFVKFHMKSENLFHLLAIVTVCIWGTTFVSSKILISSGLPPAEIFLYRFLVAYICLLAISHKKFMANSLRDELFLLLAGLFGGSLYFITENTALEITQASNVSLLVCTTPVFTQLLSRLFYKETFRRFFLPGTVIALTGVALIVCNGNETLEFNLSGDLLTLAAAVSWALYCMVLRRLGSAYPTLFITRKVFFYGILSLPVYFAFRPEELHIGLLLRPEVYSNLLFLGLIASMLCYISWNATVRMIGASKASNYLYINPLATIITAHLILGEKITLTSLLGAACIVGGVYLAERK